MKIKRIFYCVYTCGFLFLIFNKTFLELNFVPHDASFKRPSIKALDLPDFLRYCGGIAPALSTTTVDADIQFRNLTYL